MEIPVRLGRVQSLQEHFQISTPHGVLTKALFDGVRGCCFSVHLQTSSATKSSRVSGSGSAPSCLVFRNFYTAALRLVQLHTDGSSTVLLDEYPLMQHIHCEDDAQNWHLLQLDKMQAPVDMTRHESFVVYLFQPSPLWEKWELQSLKFYAAPPSTTTKYGSSHPHSLSLPIDEQSFKFKASNGVPSPTNKALVADATIARSNSYTASSPSSIPTNQSDLNQQHQERERLTKRPSRMALAACVESKDVQENALQCLTLVERLRVLLHSSEPS